MNWISTALITSASWGLTYVAAEIVLKNIDKKFYLLISSFLNFVFWLAVFLVQSPKIDKISYSSIFWMFIACFSATIGSYFCISSIQGKNAVSASVVEISYPLFCVLFSLLITGRSNLTLQSFFGMFIVMIGMIIFVVNQK